MTVDAFSHLHPRILSGLEILRISGPTPPQEKAMGLISEGENVLLVAPTASGKTEAALLPLFDALLRSKEVRGIEVVYITPLRALNRDIQRRLDFWADHLDLDVQIRHGDTSQRMRRLQASRPPRVLITTPETLQAILPSKAMRENMIGVRWVIVDEIHELADSKRGAQLTIGLERLERIVGKPVQRIGLSATVGNPSEVAGFLGGLHPISVIEVEVDKTYSYKLEYPLPEDDDFELADDMGTSPEAASRLRRMMNLVKERRSTLIFVQGRGQAESLGHKLWKIEPLVEVHHGSLSREQRHDVEDRFKEGKLRGIVCTSTLQLGIDIGDVDLCIQYLSPRQVSTLIQRVGRAGHTLGRRSEGVLISAYGEDALESLVAALRARKGELERTEIHVMPLDVFTHQIVGLTLDEGVIDRGEVYDIITRTYPFREMEETEFFEQLAFLATIGLLSEEGEFLKKTGKGRKYYYENLGMINDERRYPFINVVTDRVIGTVGDEFWTLRARLGLNVILKGRVWRILQIDEERGVLHVLPSDDPLGALPGWDGELIPVPRDLAEDVGELRERISSEMDRLGSKEAAVENLSSELGADVAAIGVAADEIDAHRKAGFPLPTRNRILLEAYEHYLIIHATFGERVNRTLGAILDAILSDHDLIYTWWNDPYRILIEAPRKLDKFDLEKIRELIFGMDPEDVERKLGEFMEARFPFGYKMKFIAERFGVIPRGKTLSSRSLQNLYIRFKDTPIYRETLREAHQEKLDLTSVKEIVSKVASGVIKVISIVAERPSPLARHILEKYADAEELMESTISVGDQLEYMRKSIMARKVKLACMGCGDWSATFRVRELEERPTCGNCGSNLLAVLKRHQDPEAFLATYSSFRKGERLNEEEGGLLTRSRKTADMVLSYGRRAVEALMVYGVGPVTSYQVLSKMHHEDMNFYADLLKAKIQYMKTRKYWDEM